MGIVSPLDLRSFVRLFIAVAGVGHIINIYPSPLPSPDLTVAWSQTGAGHSIVAPCPGIRGAAAMFCIRGDWRVRVMLFVTDIPGAQAAVVKCVMLSNICFLHKPGQPY